MIKTITQYPTQTGFDFGGTVRHFDDTLDTLIKDIKDTIEANDIEGLSAFQIGSPLNVIVIKYEGQYLEFINPSIFVKEGEIHPTESTAYYPNLTAITSRAKYIKVVYEDSNGVQQFFTAEDDLAVLIQRKNDYLMGSTFISRLSTEEKKIFEKKLQGVSSDAMSCTLSPFSDKILTAIKYSLLLGAIALPLILKQSFIPSLQMFETYLMWMIIGLISIYFVRAMYEGKRCGVCQLGNVAAMTLIKSLHLGVLYAINTWLLF